MQPDEIVEVLDRPISQELLARDVTRLACVAKDGTPCNVPVAFTWSGSHIVMLSPGRSDEYRRFRVSCTEGRYWPSCPGGAVCRG